MTFAARPDFADAPGDADGDNVYVVRLSVSDGRETASIDLKVTVEKTVGSGIRVRRIVSGFVSPVESCVRKGGGEILVAQRDGTIIGIATRAFDGAQERRAATPMFKLQPNGLLAVTANMSVPSILSLPLYNLNYLYLDTAQRL